MTEIPKSEVSTQVADQIDVGPPPVRLSGGRSYKGLVVVIALMVLAAAAFVWLSYGERLAELSGAAPERPVSVGDSVATAEFTAFQAQTSASLQSATQLLASQQTELKRLSDQLAALTARIDGLQGTIAAAAPPAAASSAPAAAAPVAAAPRPTAPRKRPAAPAAPAGAISVGGAPLPSAGPSAR